MSENITYWTTTDPRVLDWCAANERAYVQWMTKVKDFQDAHDVRLLGGRNPFNGLTETLGVAGDTSRLPGRWTKPDSRGRCRPFADNREGRMLLGSLDQPGTGPIPGLPRLMEYMTVEREVVTTSVAFASGGREGVAVRAVVPQDGPPAPEPTPPALDADSQEVAALVACGGHAAGRRALYRKT